MLTGGLIEGPCVQEAAAFAYAMRVVYFKVFNRVDIPW